MKKNLLTLPSNLQTKFQLKSLKFLLTTVIILVFAATNKTTAQCNYLYQGYESFKAVAGVSGVANTTPALITGYTETPILANRISGVTGNSYTGNRSLVFNNTAGYIITPRINSISGQGTIRLSFMARQVSTNTIPGTLVVDYSANYGGAGTATDAAGVTWTSATTTPSAISLTNATVGGVIPWLYCYIDINPGASGVYVRIRRTNATGAQPQLDDLAWYSSIAAENNIIVMPTNGNYVTAVSPTNSTTSFATPCYSTTSKAISFSVDPLNTAGAYTPITSTTTLASGTTYKLYDNGGNTDNLTANVPGSDFFNLNQNNTVVFTPASGDRIEFNNSLVYSGTGTATGSLTLTRPSGTILATTTSVGTPTSYNGNYCETSTLNYTTSASGTILSGFGLYTEIKSAIPTSCAAVTGLAVTTANVTYSTIPITWTQITGCSVPAGGYDYYVTTTGSTPPLGANTVINTTNTQANNVASGASTGVTVTGLTGGTIYKIWVRTNCGGTSYGAWQQIGVGYTAVDSAGTTFTGVVKTVCTPQNVTYTENFQGSLTAIPTCTSTTSGSSGIANYSGNYVFYNSATGTSFLTQPVNLDSSKIYRLSYDYGNSTNGATAVFQIYYGSTAYTATTSNITTSIVPSVTGSSSTLTTGRYYFQPPSTGIYYIRFAYNSNAGGGSLLLDNIEIAEVPCYPAALATVLSGASSPCAATSVVYTITAPATANSSTPTSYTVTAPSGWVVTGTSGNTVTVFTGAIPGNITVISNLTGCDSSLPVNFPVSTSAPPAQPSVISGVTSTCSASPQTYSVTNVPGTTYNWTFPVGWTFGGATTNSVSATPPASGAGTITVTPTVGGCVGTPRTLNVSVGSITNNVCTSAVTMNVLTTPTASDTFRCSTRHFWYSFVAPCTGVYKVRITGNGGDIDLYTYNSAVYTCAGTNPANLSTNVLAQGLTASATESVNINVTSGNTYYILVYDFSNGSGGTFNLSVLTDTIGTLGTISGISSVSCSSTTTTTYTITAGAPAPASYTWTLPSGWSGSSTTNSITVTSNGTTGGTISVVGNSACGSTVPVTKDIAVGQVQPDSISGSNYLCSPFSATTYTVTPVEGAVSYIWTVPGGWSGSSTTNSISITPNATSGTITVKAVGPCGTSAAASLAITTKASVTTTNVAICAGDISVPMTSTATGVTTFTMPNIGASPTFVRPLPGVTYAPSTVTAIYGYIAFTPTVSGNYTFDACDTSIRDTFMVLYTGSFNPASPGTNFFAANDDSNPNTGTCNLDPRISTTTAGLTPLVAGQTYILVITAFASAVTSISGITITVTPPAGGLVQVGTTQWYDDPTAGNLLYTGNSFNPEGVALSGVPNTSATYVGTYTYYATNPQVSACRTPTTFTISNAPTQTITPAASAICPNSYNAISANATGTGVTTVWTSNVANTLFSDALGTAYVPGTNAAVVYLKSAGTVTVTVLSSVGSCSVTSNVTYTVGASVTWDGFTASWSNGTGPTANDAIVINNGWGDGDLTGCSCTVNSGTVIFNSGETLTLTNELTVLGGSVQFEDESSLYQTSAVGNTTGSYSGGNSGIITYKRISQPMFKYDFTYWSSPVSNQNLFALSPGSQHFYQYNYTTQAWQFANTGNPMEVARGYIIRAPLNFPEMPFFPATNFTASFTGVPNNGTISYPITSGTAQMNLIGNPYSSAVSANDFISATANNNITGTLYFWTHNTYINASGQYVTADYASYNLSGGVYTGSGSGNTLAPVGYIASGQGFFVKGITGTPSGSSPYSITFANSMRRAGLNDRTNFYKNNQSIQSVDDYEKDRFWLNITNPEGGFKQTLIGYIENATDGLDRMYDGDLVDVGTAVTLYSIVDNNFLTIQGRQLPFNINDVVPLGYKSLTTGNCTIQLDHFDTYFNNQDIFIEDKLLGVIHNLKEAHYTFSTNAGTFNDRFLIRYTSEALDIKDIPFNENSVKVYKNANGLHILTGAVMMHSVKVFDIGGRLLASRDGINATETSFTTLPVTEQVLLVQITSEEGVRVTKKVVY